MHDRTGWTRGKSGAQVIRGRTYDNLVEFYRTCANCEKPFSIFVTAKIAAGHADSNSFGLKNCEAHRRNKASADNGDTETLRSANVTMREELTGLYERVRMQFEELQVLKAKLSVYELGPAMHAQAAAIGCEPVQNTTNGALLPKMPWE